ncbi:alpha/beta fold hydrolase [Pedobacter sp. P351]|uniref:alpha/beta fold hydrolase n=1 Tax=Pedobacter superstes TaxID=3133441 RepID=UPI0030B798C3
MRINFLFIFLLIIAVFDLNAQSKKPVIMIVHGAWGGGWAFKKVDSILTEKGIIAYRPTLTGQGERVHLASADVGLVTHINDIVNSILFEDLHDIVLVGHSYGGMVISGVADRVPERIRKLIYMDAFVPNDGESVAALRNISAEELKRMGPNGFMVPAWVKAGQQAPMDVPHSLKTFTEKIVLKNAAAKKLDAAYILTVDAGKKAEDDAFASSAERARQRNWPVVILQADHNPQWSAPVELVDKLLSLMSERKN